MSSDIPLYNNVPFSGSGAYCTLPSSRFHFEIQYTNIDNGLPSFFDHPAFEDSTTYHPPSDFLSCPQRVSGEVPEIVYPEKLVSWFSFAPGPLPFVYENALDLYFSIQLPFSYLSNIFSGPEAVPESKRKNHVLSMISHFGPHLVHSLFSSFFFYSLTFSSRNMLLLIG